MLQRVLLVVVVHQAYLPTTSAHRGKGRGCVRRKNESFRKLALGPLARLPALAFRALTKTFDDNPWMCDALGGFVGFETPGNMKEKLGSCLRTPSHERTASQKQGRWRRVDHPDPG